VAKSVKPAKTRLRNALARIPHLARALALVWAAAQGWTIAWALLLAIQGLLPVATVYLVRLLVDSLVAAAGTGAHGGDIRQVVLYGGLMAAVMLAQQVAGTVNGWVRSAQAEHVRDHITAMLQEQSCALDLAFYESPDHYDRLHRARQDAMARPLILENVGGLLQSCLTLVAMAAVLVPYGAWLPLALLVSTLPAFAVVVRYAVKQYRWTMRVTEDQRRVGYLDWLMSSRENASELRLFDLGGNFRDAYRRLRARLRGERLALARDQVVAQLVASVFGLLVTGGALAWMGSRVLRGPQTLGDLALFYQAFNKGQGLMHSLLGGVSQIYSNSLFLENLFEYLGLQPQVQERPEPNQSPPEVRHEIHFRGVTFRYPGSERPVLEGFALVIPAGRVVAIVGANGAGKSPLFLLICRLYDPENGTVEIDGRDLRELSLAALRRAISVLFQEPVHYHASARDNIAVGDLAASPDHARVVASAQAAGSHDMITSLPDGYDTLLSRWFKGGTELSGGEWQRIALSRAFLRDAPLILLDEPTSAMDSWAETEWVQRFRHLAEGRTAVIITHRFTTAMWADIIHVMDRGRIVESGSHGELLRAGGRYAAAWNAQMQASEGDLRQRRG